MRFLTIIWLAFMAATFTNPAQADEPFIVLQSTTSTQNSGLLDAILPRFLAKTGINVRVVAVGTGQAIKNARNGDGDVLLVHSKAAEQAFVAEGWGVQRFDVMYNDFVIIGPSDDPAKVGGMNDAVAALQQIAQGKALFASRGDESGTHRAELDLWAQTGVEPQQSSGTWYRETGTGMGATLNTAIGMGAYALTDRATWLAFGAKGRHQILVQGDTRMFNQYGVIMVNPARHPRTKAAQAEQFITWLIGPGGQAAIAGFTLEGEQLFFPNARP